MNEINPIKNKKMTWFPSNKLTVHSGKREAVCFGFGRPETFNRGDTELNYKISCRYVGFFELLFRDHIDYVVRKTKKTKLPRL